MPFFSPRKKSFRKNLGNFPKDNATRDVSLGISQIARFLPLESKTQGTSCLLLLLFLPPVAGAQRWGVFI